MKKRNFFIFVALGIVIAGALRSCASTQHSYAEVGGKLTDLQRHRVANYVAVQRIQRIESTEAKYAELDFKRLQNQAAMADSLKGYEGKIFNLSRWENIQVQVYRLNQAGRITSERPISSYIAPGQQLKKYLLPGEYLCIVYVRGQKEAESLLRVTSQLTDVFGEPMHWYAVWDRGR